MRDMVLPPQEFITQLREIGFQGYHHRHPFMRLLHEGKLTREQVRGWAVQRYYYQRRMPVKNAAILSNCPVAEVRRNWSRRVIRQAGEDEGGYLELWRKFCEATGVSREELETASNLPGVRLAVDAYVEFCLYRSWIAGVASTLSELFFSEVVDDRIRAFERFYPWIAPSGLEFWRRGSGIVRDLGEETVSILLEHCTTERAQEEARTGVEFKNGILRSVLDAIHMAYVEGRPEGA